ncbi:hypothetical protein OEZ85_014168 [Tetradesmus obliquus]|uniref:Protein dpy-30 homolog n=1 Tax=Tetradesmus obliquus TaxID=3088 RepID=A0ABY8UA14_TETOB|nr:hypothetical protein OEZ85_014168 [Tetradesmus obliquus]
MSSGVDQPMADAAGDASKEPSTQDNVKAAEKAAVNIQKRLTSHALPIRQYLESTVVPLLMQGLQSLCKERPEDPVEYLANYLLQHNPKKGPAGPAAASGTAVKQE